MTLAPRRLLQAYVTAMLAFLLLDACWLSYMGPRLYSPALAGLLAPEVNWLAALLFYLLYLAGLLVFAIRPALEQQRPALALRLGALFGLVAYATYDLTNQATLRDWPWLITVADLIWGSFASGSAAWVAARLGLRLTSRP